MNCSDPLNSIASAVYDSKSRLKKNCFDSVDVILFQQSWGNTSGGFQRIGGSAITKTDTIVIRYASKYLVYFGGIFAYEVVNPCEHFREDLRIRKLAGVKDCINRYENVLVSPLFQ